MPSKHAGDQISGQCGIEGARLDGFGRTLAGDNDTIEKFAEALMKLGENVRGDCGMSSSMFPVYKTVADNNTLTKFAALEVAILERANQKLAAGAMYTSPLLKKRVINRSGPGTVPLADDPLRELLSGELERRVAKIREPLNPAMHAESLKPQEPKGLFQRFLDFIDFPGK